MRILAVRFSRNIPEMKRFYVALGLDPGSESRTGMWHELSSSGGLLALHGADGREHPDGDADADAGGVVELSFEADEPLEAVKARLEAAGFAGAEIIDEAFGRSLQTVDPDGVHIQVNESDAELYT